MDFDELGSILDGKFDIMLAAHFAEVFQGVLKKIVRNNILCIETLLARFNTGQGEQVFSESRHASRILADDLQKLANVIVLRDAIENGFGVSLNRSQRRTQFMRDVGNEVSTCFFHALGFSKIS